MDSVDLCKDEAAPKGEAIDCVVPITPDAVAENGDIQSPLTLTVVRKQLKLACIDSDSGSPRTPKDGVFDPFAPGPDNMVKAPQSNKYIDEYRNTVARQLNFQHDHDDAESLSDQDMVESVYENLLQVFLSIQAEGFLTQLSNDCTTPPSPLCLAGISDTCPAAPMKPAAKPRNIQLGLCKKLEF